MLRSHLYYPITGPKGLVTALKDGKISSCRFLTLLLLFSATIAFAQTPPITMDQFIGTNVLREDPTGALDCVGFIREYHDWSIDEGDYYNPNPPVPQDYPNNQYMWNPPYQGQTYEQFDGFYNAINGASTPNGIPANSPAPICVSLKSSLPSLTGAGVGGYGSFSEFKPVKTNWFKRPLPNHLENPNDNANIGVGPVSPDWDGINPSPANVTIDWNWLENPYAYKFYADWVTNFAGRYGQFGNGSSPKTNESPNTNSNAKVGYLEIWNEEDKWWISNDGNPNTSNGPNDQCNASNNPWLRMTKFCAAEYAAMLSAAYDGDEGSIPSPYNLGAKTKAKVVFGGLSECDQNCEDFVTAVNTWSNSHRDPATAPATDNYPYDVLNFHHYSDNNWSGLGTSGVPPELDAYPGTGGGFLRDRLKYLRGITGKELWLSEFGYDTNDNSPVSVPVITSGNETWDKQEVQAQWIVRTYLEVAWAGWDRAMQFTFKDSDSGYTGGSPFYSSGMLKDKAGGYDPKKSYYYVYTTKNALSGTKYSGDESTNSPTMRVYRFTKDATPNNPNDTNNPNDKYTYAVWSPTKTGIKHTDFTFSPILPNGNTITGATLIEMVQGDIDGVKYSSATSPSVISVSGGAITIHLGKASERPVYVQINTTVNDPSATFCSAGVNAQGVSCDAVKLSWTAPSPTPHHYQIYYYESDAQQAPAFNIGDPKFKLYSNNSNGSASNTLVAGLPKPRTQYWFYVIAVFQYPDAGFVLSPPCTAAASTLYCDNNNLAVASWQTDPIISNSTAGLMFGTYLTPCTPVYEDVNINLDGNNESNGPADGWIEEYTGGANNLPVNKVTVNFGAVQHIEAIQILDGPGVGSVKIYVPGSPNSPLFPAYVTDGYGVWKTFAVNVTTDQLVIERSKITQIPTINRVLFKGTPAAGNYATNCCTANINIGNGGEFLLSSLTAGTNPTLNPVLTQNQIISVNGILVIDQDYEFNNSKLLMLPGSGISVGNSTLPNPVFQLTNQSVAEGCEQMWKGVYANPGAKVNVDNSAVRDAEYGIIVPYSTASSGGSQTQLGIERGLFQRNYYGIYIDARPGNFSPLSGINHSAFTGNNENLKPCFSGQTNCFSKSYCGVYANKATLFIGASSSASAPNRFENLMYGVMPISTTLTLENTKFNDMYETDVYSQPDGGYGVWQYGGLLLQNGFGKNGPASFTKTKYGIFSRRGVFEVKNNRMEVEAYGFMSFLNEITPNTNLINFNYIDTKGSGIRTELITYASKIDIMGNTIEGNKKGAYDGIYCSGFDTPKNFLLRIGLDPGANENYIRMQQGATGGNPHAAGIRVVNLRNVNILTNTINFTQYDQFIPNYGIQLLGTQNSNVSHNKLLGIPNGGGYYQNSPEGYGIYLSGSKANFVTCNRIDGAKYGLTFEADCTQKSGISTNEVYKHGIGLWLKQGAATGQQTNTGNRWEAIAAGNHIVTAKFDGLHTSQELLGSRFTVKQNEPLIDPYPSLDADNDPNNNPDASSLDWFFRDPNGFVPAACAPPANSPDGDFPTELVRKQDNFTDTNSPYRKLADGSLDNSGLSAAGLWALKRHAFADLYDVWGNASTGIATLDNFRSTNQSTTVGQFYNIDKAIEGLYQTDPVKMQRASELIGLIGNHVKTMHDDVAQTGSLPFSQQVAAAALRQTQGKDASLYSWISEYVQLFQDIEALAKSQAQAIKTQNATITTTANYEAYEKEANNDFLDMVANGQAKPTAAQAASLATIGQLCPDEAGLAGYKAIVLYSLYNRMPLPMWKSCGTDGRSSVPQPDAAPASSAFRVRPIPASDRLVIETAFVPEIHADFGIYDLAGVRLLQGILASDSQEVDISSLSAGIYFLVVHTGDQPAVTQKIVVLK